jgi:ABC-type amino acid transport system permease subunit
MISEFTQGAIGTLTLFFFSFFPGAMLGIASAAVQTRMNGIEQRRISFVSLFATVPLLALLFWFHYPLQSLLGVVWSGWTSTVVVLIVLSWANAHSIFSSALAKTIDQHLDAVIVLEIGKVDAFRKVFIPLALFAALHRFAALAIVILHATMFASLLGVTELFRAAQRLNAEYLQPVEIFSLMGGIYVMLCGPLLALELFLKSRYERLFGHA